MMNDRFIRGMVGGIIAGVPTFLFNWGAFHFGFATLRWVDFMSIFTAGREPAGLFETAFTTFGVYVWLGILGVFFSYLVPVLSHRYLVIKAWSFSTAIWLGLYAISIFFKIPQVVAAPFNTVISHFFGATIWGITLGIVLGWLDNKSGVEAG